jgi:hypothetical protein
VEEMVRSGKSQNLDFQVMYTRVTVYINIHYQ